MILVVTYSRAARTSLRNVARAHDATVVRQAGRFGLFRETEFGAFLAIRLREKHGEDVQLELTRPFNEFGDVPARVREAAAAYEARSDPFVPYATFAARSDLPAPEEFRERTL